MAFSFLQYTKPAAHHATGRVRIWLAALLAMVVVAPAIGAAPSSAWQSFRQPWFESVGVAQGLRDPVTTAIEQDRHGLIWIGTLTGLVRWDGYRAMPVLGPGNNDGGLDDTYVRALLALPDGSMLIGTNSGGLARFEPVTGRIRVHRINATAGVDGKVFNLAPDRQGGAWVAMEQGLYHFQRRHLGLGPRGHRARRGTSRLQRA